jgi:hypothetical protein
MRERIHESGEFFLGLLVAAGFSAALVIVGLLVYHSF